MKEYTTLKGLDRRLKLVNKINRAGDNNNERQRKIFANLVEWVEQEFLEDDFGNTTDENIEIFNGLIGGNFEKIKVCLENDLTSLLEVISIKVNSDIDIIPNNSFRDILGNLSAGYFGSYKRVLNDLSNDVTIKSARQTLAKQFVELFTFLDYYIVELITDTREKTRKSKDKLRAELELENGYVGRFSKYLTKQCPVSNPSVRLVLFYFFSKLEKGYFGETEYKNALEKFLEDTKLIIIYNGQRGIEQFLDMNKIKNNFATELS